MAIATKTIKLTVTRYRPGQDRAPITQSYDVPYNEDWVVLDALQYIKDQEDGTLSFRWSCRITGRIRAYARTRKGADAGQVSL